MSEDHFEKLLRLGDFPPEYISHYWRIVRPSAGFYSPSSLRSRRRPTAMARREADAIPLSRFGVLVAQLQSIVVSARQQTPDALLCFDLLSELVSSVEEENKVSPSFRSLFSYSITEELPPERLRRSWPVWLRILEFPGD